MFISACSISFLSAFGLDFFLKNASRNRKVRITPICWMIGCALSVIVITLFSRNTQRLPSFPATYLVLICLSIPVVFLFARRVIGKAGFSTLILLLLTVDLVSAHLPLNPLVSEQFYTKEPDLADSIKSGRLYVDQTSFDNPNGGQPPPAMIQQLWREALFPNTGTLYDISYVNGLSALETQHQWFITELLQNLNPHKQVRFFQLTGTRHFITHGGHGFESQLQEGNLIKTEKSLYEVTGFLPRAYMVGRCRIVADRSESIEAALDMDFDPRQLVLLEQPAEGGSGGGGGTVIKHTYEGTNRIAVTVKSLGGWLILLDSFYPGWQAFINGQETAVLRANGFFKSIRLSPGTHDVLFVYRPSSFSWAKWVSLTSLLGLTIGLLIFRFKSHITPYWQPHPARSQH